MASPSDAANEQFASHRDFLRLLIRMQLGPKDRGQIDPSDVVQETLLKAHERREQFRGTTPQEREAWLRRILATTLADAYRRLGRQAQNLDDQLGAAIEESSARIDKLLDRREQLARLDAALEELPSEWREVVELRHLHGQSVPEIAAATNRTKDAVAGLLRRGMRRLRELMGEPDGRWRSDDSSPRDAG